ncbi:bZIP transcription factor 29-like [Phragmites australis]|uniref:bZIP transcription factor 29-like n=1 Tax=Phragmites australis TaxID=29695 RepID=UPI002D788D4E|nr:bZIP transcription factor 29-like [Phragmites australis]
MEEDRADPSSRPPVLSPPSAQPPRAPAVPMDLSSQYHRHFSSSLFLSPVAPRLPSVASGSDSTFSYYQSPPALAPAAGGGGSHLARSLPQPRFFPMDSLAPLPYAQPAAGAGAAVLRSPPSPGFEQGPSALPPRGAGHRRSQSDFLVGFSRPSLTLPVPPTASLTAEGCSKSVDATAFDDLFSRDLRGMGVLGSSGDGAEERHDYLGGQVNGCPRAWSPAESSDNEAESWATGGRGRGGASHPRHCRSLSVDSIMGSLNIGALGQESSRLPPPSPAAGAGGGLSRTGSGPSGGAAALFATELAKGEFDEAERKKIMANDRLAEIALTDPKRVKRILANRVSAAKSKERKVKYMGELERRVQVLLMETATLSAKVAKEQRESDALKTQNNEMKIRLQALEQQAQLKDALNEALSNEVQRLKHAAGETSDPRAPNGSDQRMNRHMIQQRLLQLQKQPLEPQQAQQQQQQQKQTQESKQFKAQQQQWNH